MGQSTGGVHASGGDGEGSSGVGSGEGSGGIGVAGISSMGVGVAVGRVEQSGVGLSGGSGLSLTPLAAPNGASVRGVAVGSIRGVAVGSIAGSAGHGGVSGVHAGGRLAGVSLGVGVAVACK